jgi:hypothetical protein
MEGALGVVTEAIEINGEQGNRIQSVIEFLTNLEATLAELIGTDSPVFEQAQLTSSKAEQVAGFISAMGAEFEYLQEHLQAIQ